jgi:hypothetical protein
MRRGCLLSLLVLHAVFSLPAASVDECFALIDCFGASPAEIEGRIDRYARARQEAPGEGGAELALAILYVALDSRADAGRTERGEYAEKALAYAEAALRAGPENDLKLLFYGIARSLRARNSRNPFTKMSDMKKAVSSLDRAVETSASGPREWYVRFMRANTYANTPPSMGKWGEAEGDYRFLCAYVKAHPEREPYLVAAEYYRALMKKEAGDESGAQECALRSLALEEKYSTRTSEAALAAALLKELQEGKK